MTNDELLSGFLDRSLSEDSLLEFEARQQASPAFAREVQEMLAVETALATVTPIVAIPTGFLQRVEDAVAGKVASGASASTGFVGGLSATWTWVGTAALVALGTAATVYLISPSHVESHDSGARPSVAQPRVAPSETPVALPSVVPSESRVARPSVTPSDARVARPSVAQSEPRFLHNDSREAQLDINNQSSVIASLRKDLDRCMAQNNRMECALIARTLGAKLRSGGSFDESRVYLQQSLDIARSMHLVQYEVGALGELGLLARDRGNTAEARTLLQQAITKAASIDAATAAPYEKALNDLGQ
ncbi:hypothetical protein BH10BAC6_BH10BAC6_06440 [soil metagenome]